MYFKKQILKELEGLPEFSCWEVCRDSHLANPPSQSLKEDVASGLLWCGRPCPVLGSVLLSLSSWSPILVSLFPLCLPSSHLLLSSLKQG